MFLQVSVILFTGGGCLAPGGSGPGGVPGPGRSGPGGCLVEIPRTSSAAGGTYPTGMHSCIVRKVQYKRLPSCSLH